MSGDDAYWKAEFFACVEPDTLTARSPRQAILDWIESEDCDTEEILVEALEESGELVVRAYNQTTPTEKEIDQCAHDMLERLIEETEDELGADQGSLFKDGAFADVKPLAVALVERLFTHQRWFQCEEVGERTFSKEEVLAIWRENNK